MGEGEKVNLRLHNAMIEVAVCEFWEKMIAETDWSKNGDHEFSDRHKKKIKAVIKKHKAKTRRNKLLHSTKRIAMIALILFAVLSATALSSSAIRREILRITSNILEIFHKEHPDATPGGDEFNDFQTDIQIEQIENAVSNALTTVGLPPNTSFEIHVDGKLNLTLYGLDEADVEKIKPYIEPMVGILSSAYASENKNEIYYVQMIIRDYESIKRDTESENYKEMMEFYSAVIQGFLDNHEEISLSDIIQKIRIIHYADGKLNFDEK